MSDDGSISQLIESLKRRDEQAIQRLWDRVFRRLVAKVHKQLRGVSPLSADEDDLARSAFNTLCLGAIDGRFDLLRSREDLWRLLFKISGDKVKDNLARKFSLKRRGEVLEADLRDADHEDARLEQLATDLTADELAVVTERLGFLLGKLGDEILCRIATMKMQGFTNAEIAKQLSISVSSVERKLRLIREKWANERPDA